MTTSKNPLNFSCGSVKYVIRKHNSIRVFKVTSVDLNEENKKIDSLDESSWLGSIMVLEPKEFEDLKKAIKNMEEI